MSRRAGSAYSHSVVHRQRLAAGLCARCGKKKLRKGGENCSECEKATKPAAVTLTRRERETIEAQLANEKWWEGEDRNR